MSAKKIAIVTGGSRGIGRSIALALGKSGCSVLVNYRSNKEDAEYLCGLMRTKYHVDALSFQADCSNASEVSTMVDFAKQEFGRIDILVNNVGISHDKLAIKTSATEFSEVIQKNLNSAFYCSRESILKSMLMQKSGRIINISSVVGVIGNAGQTSYAASKAGMIGLTKSLAREYAGRSITVNAVCPGYIETDMTAALPKEEIIDSIPLKRMGTPEEVAGLVRYLALDESAAYITGHSFFIDGGLGIGSS